MLFLWECTLPGDIYQVETVWMNHSTHCILSATDKSRRNIGGSIPTEVSKLKNTQHWQCSVERMLSQVDFICSDSSGAVSIRLFRLFTDGKSRQTKHIVTPLRATHLIVNLVAATDKLWSFYGVRFAQGHAWRCAVACLPFIIRRLAVADTIDHLGRRLTPSMCNVLNLSRRITELLR